MYRLLLLVLLTAIGLPANAAREARLIDQHGHAFTLSQLRKTPLVVTFVSAHCKDVCPLINEQTSLAVKAAGRQHLNVKFLTITLDPEQDSLHDMRMLALAFDANPKNWIVAGGNLDDVHAVMQSFHVRAQRGRDGYADVHSTFVYLVDRRGVVRRTMLVSANYDRDIIASIHSNWHLLTQ